MEKDWVVGGGKERINPKAEETSQKVGEKGMNEANVQIMEYKQQLLEKYLSECTTEQREFFNRMYPKGPRPDQVEWAIQQCINTLKKNVRISMNKDECYCSELSNGQFCDFCLCR